MMKKRLSKKIWYGYDVDSEGNPVLPPLAADSNDLEGLHYGELYLHIADDKLSLWTRTLTDQVKQIGGSGSGDGELWQLRQTDAGEPYLFSPFDVAVQRGLTSYVDGGDLDLPSIYKGLPIDNRTLKWEEVTEQVGTDEEGNPIYETTKVLKAAGGGGGTGGDSVNWDDIKAEISKNYVSSNKGKRTIWGQPLKGIDNITGDLTLGNKSKLIIPSFYDYNRFEVYANDEGVFIGASDKQGSACANGYITIGGIKNDKWKWWLNSFKINGDTKINGDLILSADDDAKPSSIGAIYFGGDIYGASISSEKEKQLSINVQNGVLINGGLLTYNEKDGYFQFDGNLVVTGGLTTFADSGAGNQWIMDAETLEEVTSKNEFKVYSAKVTSMIAASISGATTNATNAIEKLEKIKTELSKLSSSSSASAIGSALNTLAGNL